MLPWLFNREYPEHSVTVMNRNVFDVKEPGYRWGARAMQKMESELRPLQPGAILGRQLARKLPPLDDLPLPRPKHDVKDLLDSDDDLKELLDKRNVRTLVVGVGGAGNNVVSRFQQLMLPGCRTLCINTDVQDLYYSNADEKILIGKRLTRGLGAGNNHEIGELAASEDYDRIKSVLNADVVFLTCGLGGGTGTGATPLVAKAARETGAVVISIVNMPFKMEGTTKEAIAYHGLKELAVHSDTVIPLQNQRLLEIVPDIKLHQGFKLMDEILMRSVNGIIDLITRPGLVNLDFADIKTILEKKSTDLQDCIYATSVIGMTEVSRKHEEHIEKYTVKVLNNPLIAPDTSEIKNALVGIAGDTNVSLRQINTVVETVSQNIHPSANLKWGFINDPSLQGKLRITVLGNGFRNHLLERAIQEFGEISC